MLRAVALALVMLLAACAPMQAPQGIENIKAAIQDNAFATRDGLHLPLRHWDAKTPKAVIVALHGMSDYSNAFAMPAPYWAEHDITTFAYDQRGFGAGPDPGVWAGGDAMRADLGDFVDAARAKYPGLPVYALGESMGGAVVLTALASDRPPAVDGAILVAPAIWSREDMPLSYRALLWTGAHTMPWIRVSPPRALKIWPSDNIPMMRALAHDPLFQKQTRADAVWGLVNLMDDARTAPQRLTHPPPILFLYGAHDQVIPRGPTDSVVAALGARAEVHLYPNGYHMLMRDLNHQTVWDDLVSWVINQSQKKK
jgi:acylglycerol lipase